MKFNKPSDIAAVVPSAYELISEENITAIDSTAAILRHSVSGAHVAIIMNDDRNKLFLAGFLTPPEDNCGTPHIIEHSVL